MLSLADDHTPLGGYVLQPVLFNAVREFWPAAWPLLQPAVDRSGGRISAQVLMEALSHGDWQLWLVVDETGEICAAIVTELVIYRTGLRTVSYLLCGGRDFKNWAHLTRAIDSWGYVKGCRISEGGGRFGFEPVMKDWGWKKAGMWLQRDLTDA